MNVLGVGWVFGWAFIGFYWFGFLDVISRNRYRSMGLGVF